jgi:two-component system, LytTR family, response regulator
MVIESINPLNVEAQKNLYIEVKTPVGFKILCIKKILFVEASRKCSIVYLDNKEVIITYHLLKWYSNYLFEPCFFRCHNSYLVNCFFVDHYCRKIVTLKNNRKIPISQKKKFAFRENLIHFNETNLYIKDSQIVEF